MCIKAFVSEAIETYVAFLYTVRLRGDLRAKLKVNYFLLCLELRVRLSNLYGIS